MQLDFRKLGKATDTREAFPELYELRHWCALPAEVARLRNMRRYEPADVEEPDALSTPEPMYEYVPEAEEIRRYLLYCYAWGSPLHAITDLNRRRSQALEKAGVTKKDAARDGWRVFLNLTDPLVGELLTELLRLTANRTYTTWLSDLMMKENLDAELRAPVEGLEDDKKGAAYERKLKISIAMPELNRRIDEAEAKLFGADPATTEAATTAALGQSKTDFAGGFAERFATNVK